MSNITSETDFTSETDWEIFKQNTDYSVSNRFEPNLDKISDKFSHDLFNHSSTISSSSSGSNTSLSPSSTSNSTTNSSLISSSTFFPTRIDLYSDRKLRKKLERHNFNTNEILDLHFCIKSEAFEKLYNFVINNYHNHNKLLLIITGKGSHSAEYESSIHNIFPSWLNSPRINSYVRCYSESLPLHGDGGSFYLWLRKSI